MPWKICGMFRRRRYAPAPVTSPFLDMPNMTIIKIAKRLPPEDLNSLLRTNILLFGLLTPVLLDHADKTILLPHGRSVLHWAAANGHDSLVKTLLTRGSCPNTKDFQRMPVLRSAMINGHTKTVNLLLENGADIEITNKHGWTALQCAAIWGNIAMVRLLVDRGAGIESKGKETPRRTALHYAVALGLVNVAKVLLDQGGKLGDCDETVKTMKTEVLELLEVRGFARVQRADVLGRSYSEPLELNVAEQLDLLFSNEKVCRGEVDVPVLFQLW